MFGCRQGKVSPPHHPVFTFRGGIGSWCWCNHHRCIRGWGGVGEYLLGGKWCSPPIQPPIHVWNGLRVLARDKQREKWRLGRRRKCVCVCVCVCVGMGVLEVGGMWVCGSGKVNERVRDNERECVCLCGCVCFKEDTETVATFSPVLLRFMKLLWTFRWMQ